MAVCLQKDPAHSSVIKSLAEGAVLITLSFSTISVLANYILFDALGIEFGYVVSPSDLFIGGVEVLQSNPFVLASLTMSLVFALYFKDKIKKIQINYLILRVMLVITFILLVYSMAPINIGTMLRGDLSLPFYISSEIYLILIPAFLLFSYLYAIKIDDFRLMKILIPSIILLLLLGGVVTSGLQRGRITLAKSINCKNSEYVVWAGTGSIVTTCSPPPHFRGKVYYMQKRDSQVFRAQSRQIGES